MQNYDICTIEQLNRKIKINTNTIYATKELTKTNFLLTPDPFPHWTIKEIYEQTESALRAISMGGRLLSTDQVKLGGLEEHVDKLTNIDNLILLGCGTSYFAGQHGVYF